MQEIYGKDPLESRPATPYFLVYIRDMLEDQLADAVRRDIVETPPDTQDTVMEEAVPSVEFEHREYANGGKLPPSRNPARGAIGGWDAHETNQLTQW